jgi:predicted O-linked N-acetylglucosamine transferase (SPINDLY family)
VTDAYYCEQLVRLPRSFFCYLPIESPPLSPLPAQANGFVTFASFNHFAKVTPKVLQTWSEILAVVPRSRLIMMTPTSRSVHERVSESFRRRGVDSARIELVPRSPYAGYLQSVARADLALDPFPFNGHTTTCDSLWMGVPVVSLAGHTYASRFGSSALATLGLADLIADSVERYLEIAVEMAANVERLAGFRQSLRQQMLSSPLCDYSGFTANLERAYRQMWRSWCER